MYHTELQEIRARLKEDGEALQSLLKVARTLTSSIVDRAILVAEVEKLDKELRDLKDA